MRNAVFSWYQNERKSGDRCISLKIVEVVVLSENKGHFVSCSACNNSYFFQLEIIHSCKCFKYVAKTIANSTTYSRNPGDYNGTIIFEFDIMKNSSLLNLKSTFFATVKTKMTLLFCWTHSTLSSTSKCDRENQNKRNNQNFCEKVKFDKDLNWLGMSFSWYQSQK